MPKHRPADILVQMGRPAKTEGRSVNIPVEMGSTMVFDTMAAFEAARDARYQSDTIYYGRYGNAPVYALEEALCALDEAEGCVLTSSGVAAITCTLMALMKAGDHLLVADNIYGNTRNFCETMLSRQGVEVNYFDPMIGADMADLFQENTTALMFEAPGSGTFETPDIPAIAAACRAADVVSVIDATWPTPLFCKPLALGVDVVVTSGSKYLNGHSDAMLGTITGNGDLIQHIRKMVMTIGDKPGGQEVALSLRGLRTLKLRMEAADRAGRDMAQWLSEQDASLRVLHPAFEDCPGHAFWKRDFTGAAGLFGVVFRAASGPSVHRFVDALQHFGIGVSWGGYESLVLPVTPHRTASAWPSDGHLVRFNIGLDDLNTLKADLAQALPLLET
ncbi:MAG: cystathionine beta-lyase [Pseudomonadota bacterium]